MCGVYFSFKSFDVVCRVLKCSAFDCSYVLHSAVDWVFCWPHDMILRQQRCGLKQWKLATSQTDILIRKILSQREWKCVPKQFIFLWGIVIHGYSFVDLLMPSQ
jgi:hypothetical protein